MLKPANPENDPNTAFIALTESPMKCEQAVVDGYRAFSAEMLRLSLLGIGVIGFIYEKILDVLPVLSKFLAAASLIFFGMAAASALTHRYFNAETIRLFLWGLRWHERNAQCAEPRVPEFQGVPGSPRFLCSHMYSSPGYVSNLSGPRGSVAGGRVHVRVVAESRFRAAG